ncbi:hypothetical protein J6590_024570 [Homalodisca vitripennis]|nr:hypothetical protein J6590_024570 [Homalodisca vitripennis]
MLRSTAIYNPAAVSVFGTSSTVAAWSRLSGQMRLQKVKNLTISSRHLHHPLLSAEVQYGSPEGYADAVRIMLNQHLRRLVATCGGRRRRFQHS